MEQVKTYVSKLFKGDARSQFEKDSKKLSKDGWRVQNVKDEGVGAGQDHTGRLTVTYTK